MSASKLTGFDENGKDDSVAHSQSFTPVGGIPVDDTLASPCFVDEYHVARMAFCGFLRQGKEVSSSHFLALFICCENNEMRSFERLPIVGDNNHIPFALDG